MIWENLHEPNLIVEVAYPVFVPKDKGNSIRHLVKKLNGQLEACQLMLERQSGRLYFKYHNKSKIAGISKRQEVIADVDRLLHIADDSFPEIMSVLYGSSFPEMASLKIFGFPDSALN